MDFETFDCNRCGGSLREIDENTYKCNYCGKTFHKKDAENHTKTFRDMFDEMKREHVKNLRRNLYDAVNAEYISNFEVKMRCEELKKFIPDDFAACFYEVAIGNNVRQLTKYLRKIDVVKNYDEIESVVRFLIKSLQTEYQLELNNLIARAYEYRDPERFEKYCTELSREAIKVDAGVYETRLPREVFIAYSSKDMDKVSELCEFLESQGLKCFVAARNLRHGKGAVENYNKALEEAMDHCRSLVFVSSMNSRSFNCDALTIELPYIQQKDLESAPAEYKNNYKGLPQEYKKPRVEYRVGESLSSNVADAISNEMFDGYERVYSPEEVAERVMKQLVALRERPARVASQPTPVVIQEESQDGSSLIERMFKRAYMHLSFGEFGDADRIFEDILNRDSNNADAYVGKLLADLKIKGESDLKNLKESFAENRFYKYALRTGNADLREKLEGYVAVVERRAEDERKDQIYNEACEEMQVNNYADAIERFKLIPSWKDSDEKIKECQRIIDERETAQKEKTYSKAHALLNIAQSDDNSVSIQQKKDSCREAMALFDELKTFKDSATLVTKSRDHLYALEKEERDQNKAEAEAGAKKIKKKRILILAASLLLVVAIIMASVLPGVIAEERTRNTYENAMQLFEQGEYMSAKSAFRKCSDYKDAELMVAYCDLAEGKVTSWKKYVKDNKLRKIVIPYGITNIESEAFSGCTEITSVTIPESVTSIGSAAFDGCSSLSSISIPGSVTSIGSFAFYKCTSLKSVTIPKSVTSIGISALASCTTVYYQGTVSQAKQLFKDCFGDTSCLISCSGGSFHSDDNGKSETMATEETTTVAEETTTVAEETTAVAEETTTVTEPTATEETTTIEQETYSHDGVEYARISETNSAEVTNYVGNATLVAIEDDFLGLSVTRIGYSAFCHCPGVTKVTTPNSITDFQPYAFANCSALESITIGNGVTSIGDYAFYSCPSLTTINYNGSKAQWQAISKGFYWNYGTGNYTVYCTDGEIPKQ